MNGLALGAASSPEAMAGRPLTLIVVMAALSLLPFVLLLMTSFVKIAVVLSILKSAIGAPQIPPGQVITGLALVLTVYVMAPVFERMGGALAPVLEQAASGKGPEPGLPELAAAAAGAREPLREFMLRHTTARDRGAFLGIARRMRPPEARAQVTDRDFLVVAPAFLTSELTRAFEIGFLLFVPFLIVDMVIANLLLALGMHMLSPTTVSLPFKLLLFVLADGWHLLLRGLVESYV